MTERENIIKQYRENIDSRFRELNDSINVIMLSDDNIEDSIGFVADDIYELLKVLCSFNTFIKKGKNNVHIGSIWIAGDPLPISVDYEEFREWEEENNV